MEKILSDIQLAEVDIRYYEILASDAMRDRCHTLAYVWHNKAEEAKKILGSLKRKEEMNDRISAYRQMEASCRERGMHEQARSWQGLAEAAQRDRERLN